MAVLYIKDENGVFKGVPTIKGEKGEKGDSAYESYLATTTDDPVLTEQEYADAASEANDAAQSATNLVNSYATDLAAKELKTNKQNSLAVDGTGTKFPTVDAVNEGLVAKANVVQEAWITPTLLNGWEEYSSGSAIQFNIDSFGYVHLRGQVKLGLVPSDITKLPLGYRPKGILYIGAYGGRQVSINQVGDIRIVSGSNGIVSLDNIIFKAEF